MFLIPTSVCLVTLALPLAAREDEPSAALLVEVELEHY